MQAFLYHDLAAKVSLYAGIKAHDKEGDGASVIAAFRKVVEAVDVPVNVLCRPGAPTVPALASVGVARISVGGGFYFAALGALASAAREWREQGTHEFWNDAIVGMQAGKQAFD